MPPRAPLGLLRFAVAFVRNPLTVLPEAVYEQPVYRYGKMLTWVTDPPLIKKILLDEYENFPKTPVERRVLAPLLGNGMLVSGGPEWKWQRQTTAPVFRQVEVLRYTPAMNTAAEDTIADRQRAQPGTVQPIDANMSDASYAVISDTMLAGADGEAVAGRRPRQRAYSWPFAYALLGLPTWLWYPNRGRKERSEKRMREAVLRLVQSRRANPGPRDDVLVRLSREESRERPADVGYAAVDVLRRCSSQGTRRRPRRSPGRSTSSRSSPNGRPACWRRCAALPAADRSWPSTSINSRSRPWC